MAGDPRRVSLLLVVSALMVTAFMFLIWSRTIDMGDLTGTLLTILLLTVVADIAMAAFFLFRANRR